MESLPVTLIVKAPNQQIEDQTVKCELSWTINKLKQHLSEVYPSKPPKHEQKLIYSGQLLNDALVLKDVLRQYEGQETHTVHLVCTPKQDPTPQRRNMTTSAPTNPPQVNRTTSTSDTRPNVQNFGNMGVPWIPEGVQIDPNYAAHMAAMQHAYFQYMNQYMQLAANSYGASQLYQPNIATQHIPNLQVPQAAQQINQQNEENEPQAPPQDQQRDPEINERDWLDNFYAISRLLVLFSVVYFYSSFLRFFLVLVLGSIMYLYQVGLFRNANNNNNNNNTVPGDPGAPQEEQAPSRFTLVWTFFTTFFASLLPEVPNAV
ncbi:homocysteine-responsive endoplasmic reticulum-resident ubiquitin-like domain member 2 protein [Harmonia axyridis]|uniref:homocysteine-responsive endoplasmic reticulum-resident ubiquitin-like domain member 2 protein n=1 Tax=Harmonia axyridis TaxID=115357 RepID=UPI001E279B14|nr:homocysteine-responsive endoplasmic reticulum-resident ubiquitin-like domain member 2 protein [Harmonia axyridis]